MKKRFTVLTAAMLLLSLMVPSLAVWGGQIRTEEVAYTLTPASGSNNSYTGNCDITISDITWNLEGNSQQIPWRLGGKGISNVDRNLKSKTAIGDNITKIEVTHGTASSITVNSWTVIVSKNSDFSSPVSTLTPSFTASATTTITRPNGADWSNCYFKFVYNVTVSGDKNKFLEFSEAKFYKESSGGGTTTYTVTYDANGGTSGDVPVDNTEYESGANVIVYGNTGNLAKEHYTFDGWNTLANGLGTTYQADDTFEITSNTTLYAKWNPNTHNVTLPTANEYGTYTMDATNPVAYGTTVELTYNPAVGCESYVATWSVNNTTIEGNSFTMPDEAVTVTVSLLELVVDNLNAAFTGNPNSYTAWSGKVGTSGAVYAGQSSGGTNYIQIRTTNSNSGIVTTTSGGKAKKVVITWDSSNQNGRTVDIYGKNTAYTQATDLYSNSNQGTKIGSIVYGTSTELTISDDYKFIGIRSNSGAAYLDLIQIAWKPNLVAIPTFSPEGGAYGGAQDVAIECETPGAIIHYTTDGSEPTSESPVYSSPIQVTETQTLKAIAIKDDDESVVATATYSIITPVTSIQAIFEAATSTSQPIAITFDNWVVSGNNGGTTPTQAYLSDGTEYGCIIYKQDGHGFVAGNILNGTVVCNVKTYTSYGYAYAQLENLTTGTSGLDVTTGGTATSTIYSISDLSAKNIGAVFTLKDITYKGSNYFQDASGNNINLSTTLYNPSSSLATGKIYDMTGVFTVTYESNSTNKRINPRSSADIVVKANMSETDFTGFTEFTYIVNNGPSEIQEIDIYGSDFASDLTVTASEDYKISLDNLIYSTSLNLEQSSGDIMKTLYVRLESGLSTGTHNGTLTFTADNLTTKVVDLVGSVTASTTYTITLTQTSGGTISADKLVAEAGEPITLSVEFDDDCTEVTEWTVSGGVEVTNNQFIMPASAVTVEATFGTKTFTINYSVNGNGDILEDYVECGDNAILYTASDLDGVVTLPTGFTLKGWSTSAGSTATVASFTPTEDATLYAVLIPEGASVCYLRITELSEITEGTYFIVNDGYVLPSATTTSSPVKTSDYNIGTPLDSYNSLPVAGTEWIFTGTNTKMTIKNSAGKYLYVSANDSKNLRVSTTEDTWCFEENDRYGVTTCGFAMKDATYGRYCASYSGGSDWRSYTSATYGNYGNYGILYLYRKVEPDVYNTVTEITSTIEMKTDITETDLVIVKTGGVLTLTGQNQGTAANLVVKDGGQLKVYGNSSKDAVEATIKKEITGFGNDNNITTGWNFIASPINVDNLAPTAVTNMLTNTYDLYRLNNTKWENYKEHEGNAAAGFSLANGRGYLYANSTDVTLSFAGAIKPFNNENPSANRVSVNAGWNLIGNPYTFDVYVNQPYYSIIQAQDGITANTTVASKATAIKPCTGILVYAKSDDYVVEFLENEPDASTGNHGNIQMTLAHNVATRDGNRVEAIDNAIVSFNENAHLEKFYFGEPEANIYIPQNGRDYAIAFSNRQGDVPLNFKTNKISTYTISFEGEEMNLNGVYLIDMLEEEEIDLGTTPSYTFLGSPSDKAARFKIVFRNTGDDADSDIFAYQNGTDIIVSGEGELQIFDVMGRKVSSQRINGVETMCTSSLQNGVYVFRLNEKTQKIVVR